MSRTYTTKQMQKLAEGQGQAPSVAHANEIKRAFRQCLAELEELRKAVRWLSGWTMGQQPNWVRYTCESILNPPEGWIQAMNPEKDKAAAQTLLKVLEDK
jgi:hypothetical protein